MTRKLGSRSFCGEREHRLVHPRLEHRVREQLVAAEQQLLLLRGLVDERDDVVELLGDRLEHPLELARALGRGLVSGERQADRAHPDAGDVERLDDEGVLAEPLHPEPGAGEDRAREERGAEVAVRPGLLGELLVAGGDRDPDRDGELEQRREEAAEEQGQVLAGEEALLEQRVDGAPETAEVLQL